VAPKFAPVIVIEAPIAAEGGNKLPMSGVGNTVKAAPGLARPFTVTTTLPVVAAAGTGAIIEVAVQFVGAAATPWNVNVLVP
jgi:hypothetical protein